MKGPALQDVWGGGEPEGFGGSDPTSFSGHVSLAGTAQSRLGALEYSRTLGKIYADSTRMTELQGGKP